MRRREAEHVTTSLTDNDAMHRDHPLVLSRTIKEQNRVIVEVGACGKLFCRGLCFHRAEEDVASLANALEHLPTMLPR